MGSSESEEGRRKDEGGAAVQIRPVGCVKRRLPGDIDVVHVCPFRCCCNARSARGEFRLPPHRPGSALPERGARIGVSPPRMLELSYETL